MYAYANVRRLDLLGLDAPASRFAVGALSYLDPENRTWVPTSSIAVGDEGHGIALPPTYERRDPARADARSSGRRLYKTSIWRNWEGQRLSARARGAGALPRGLQRRWGGRPDRWRSQYGTLLEL